MTEWARALTVRGRWAVAAPPDQPTITTRPDLFERLRWHPDDPDGGGWWRWDPSLLEKVVEAANNPDSAIADDGSLLSRLRGRAILFLGDSLDRNVLYRFVGCVEDTLLNHSASGGARCREELIDYGTGNTRHVLDGTNTPLIGARVPALGFAAYSHSAHYTVHPWGHLPLQRHLPYDAIIRKHTGADTLGLRDAYRAYLKAGIRHLAAWGGGGGRAAAEPGTPAPRLVVANLNLWWWNRIEGYRGRYNRQDGAVGELERAWEVDPAAARKLMESYKANATVYVEVARELLGDRGGKPLFAWHTDPLPSTRPRPGTGRPPRFRASQIGTVNVAVRELVDDDPQLALFDWERMLGGGDSGNPNNNNATTGFAPHLVLADDIHPKTFFSDAIANVLLNVLANMDPP